MKLGELATFLNVSPSSVSIVRQGKPGVSPTTRRRIQQAMEEYGYTYIPYESHNHVTEQQDNAQPRCIRLLKYYRSGLLANKNEGFVDVIVDAIDTIARAEDYMLIFNSVSCDDYKHFLDDFNESNCLGMLVIGTEMGHAELDMLRNLHVPVVVLDCDHPALPVTSVTMNNRDLAYEAVRKLKDFGEVGYLCSNIRTGNFTARGNGYQEAVNDFQLPKNPDLLFHLTPSLHNACEEMLHFLASKRHIPKAFFADNDVIAIGVMRALQLHGYNIPQDVNIIGVDNTMLAQVSSPALSSFQIACSTLGQQAIQLLLSQIDKPFADPVHVHIGSRLILRESTNL